MSPDDVLEWVSDPLPELSSPVMVVALEGLFDLANAATDALHWLAEDRPITTLASIDPDPFYDFSQRRPHVRLDDDERVIEWPRNDFNLVHSPDARHDVILLAGVEPHVRWGAYTDAILMVAERLACQVVVTVGGAPEQVPHTRIPLVFGSTTNDDLARRLGLSKPQYQGPTGVAGVLHARLDALRWPGIALRAPVPHYLSGARHPAATAALLTHLEHVLGIATNHSGLAGDIAEWRVLHDNAVANDPQAQEYVRILEVEFDRRLERSVTTGDQLAHEFEAFLRDLNDPRD